ncbi:GumC family protein [Flavobacterium myungsuense]|uniref:GumC family protein n=1 Tax=Flavobacterium myungsuense TaxID=651823 RepID=UPI00363F2640
MGISSAIINQLFGNYNSLIFERERLLFSAGENNPRIKMINDQLDILKNDMFKSLKNYQSELLVSLEKSKVLYQQYLEKFNKLPLYEKFIRSIERQQSIKEALYILLLQKREEAAINVAVTGPSIKVVDYASSNSTAISPKKDLIYLGSLIIGLLIPFLFVFVKNFLDNKIHNKQELLRIVRDIPIVSEVPFIGDDLKVMLDNDRSVLAESFRILRTNIGYLLPIKIDKQAPVLFVTSTIKGEGKTFTSINLGMAFATLGKKVLVIGADLRNPQFHNYTDMDKNHIGLSNYLYDISIDWRSLKVAGKFDSPDLDLIFSGIIPPNPAELLSNGRLELLLDEAKKSTTI